jgi:hypothetical protein
MFSKFFEKLSPRSLPRSGAFFQSIYFYNAVCYNLFELSESLRNGRVCFRTGYHHPREPE